MNCDLGHESVEVIATEPGAAENADLIQGWLLVDLDQDNEALVAAESVASDAVLDVRLQGLELTAAIAIKHDNYEAAATALEKVQNEHEARRDFLEAGHTARRIGLLYWQGGQRYGNGFDEEAQVYNYSAANAFEIADGWLELAQVEQEEAIANKGQVYIEKQDAEPLDKLRATTKRLKLYKTRWFFVLKVMK